MTPVLTGVQTAQQMNWGCAHIKRHLHTHELSICAHIAALLALKAEDKAICPGMSQQTAAGLRPAALTQSVHLNTQLGPQTNAVTLSRIPAAPQRTVPGAEHRQPQIKSCGQM